MQNVHPTPELLIVMPIYNEQASVRKVINEWFQEVENWTENFVILAINDGSIDKTEEILNRLRQQLGPRVEIVSRENRGHGISCLEGYRIACSRGIPYVLQIDSDGQCDPQYFFRFFRDRERFDVIYGHRTRRDDGWRRIIASFVLKMTLMIFAGVLCTDANVPYRLMKTHSLAQKLESIPPDFFLSNVALSVVIRRDRAWKHGRIPIRFRERYGGEPSVRLGRFGEKALELVSQLKTLR